mmetsp:Transcript_478/g.1587  ORF Transcript_478/g.1587 Transcript_478/m.1587 type:complete len:315 (+) Transcript_478:639-1583(+)
MPLLPGIGNVEDVAWLNVEPLRGDFPVFALVGEEANPSPMTGIVPPDAALRRKVFDANKYRARNHDCVFLGDSAVVDHQSLAPRQHPMAGSLNLTPCSDNTECEDGLPASDVVVHPVEPSRSWVYLGVGVPLVAACVAGLGLQVPVQQDPKLQGLVRFAQCQELRVVIHEGGVAGAAGGSGCQADRFQHPTTEEPAHAARVRHVVVEGASPLLLRQELPGAAEVAAVAGPAPRQADAVDHTVPKEPVPVGVFRGQVPQRIRPVPHVGPLQIRRQLAEAHLERRKGLGVHGRKLRAEGPVLVRKPLIRLLQLVGA